MRTLWAIITYIPVQLFGSLSWSRPPWLAALAGVKKRAPKRFWLALFLMVAAGAAYGYYTTLPEPARVAVSIDAPGLTPNIDKARPDPVRVHFSFEGASKSVAALNVLDKVVSGSVHMQPEARGEWRWENESTLLFTPAKDWPAGQKYALSFDARLFADGVELQDAEHGFTTPAFRASIQNLRFYKDPKNPKTSKVVGTLSFTHPVDEQSLKAHLSLYTQPKNGQRQAGHFELTFDKRHRQAYVHSDPVTIGSDESYMYLALARGIRPQSGPSESKAESRERVIIPSMYTFFRVTGVHGQIVRNEQQNNDPEQVITIEFSDGVNTEALQQHVTAWLLPEKRTPNQRYPYRWRSPSEVTSAVLSRSEKLPLELLPTERRFMPLQSFRIDAPVGRSIYVHIDRGLESEAGFKLAVAQPWLVRAPRYPQEAKIAFDGSLLSVSGDKRLTLLSRGVEALKIEVGRVLPGQLAHLVSQTSSDIRNPRFNYSYAFNEENISEIFSEVQPLNAPHPSKAVYSTLDLGRYLQQSRQGPGLFFVRVSGWDKARKRKIYGAQDRRLIMVTDIGLLVKDNVDDSHDVFVQSVRQGSPLAGAEVQVLGKNGMPIMRRTTGKDGHVAFPTLKDFKAAQTPVAYMVRREGDVSFIPYRRSQRMINYSRFDVGGVQSRHQAGKGLSAYLFSDRGIYRPGDTAHLAAIVRQRSWQPLGKMPLEVVITDPRGSVVLAHKLELPASGFFEWKLDTDTVSATGIYTARVHLVSDRGVRREEIGSATFRVEEFQPDRMKIRSQLTGGKHKGWYTPEAMAAHITLENLFGTPARKRLVKGRMHLTPAGFAFRQYKAFAFTDPLRDPKQRRISIDEVLPDQHTDDEGKAAFELPLARFDKGTYRLLFQAEGFEAGGGRSVSTQAATLVSPVTHLVGYKADGDLGFIHKDSPRHLTFIAIDPELQQIALPGLTLRLLERRHVSTLVKQRDGTFKYQSILKEKQLSESPFAIDAAGSDFALPVSEPGDFVAELRDDRGTLLSRVRYSVAGSSNLSRSLEKSAELQVKLDRKSYEPGQSIQVQITAPYTGAGLITIERDKVYAYKWFKAEKSGTLAIIRVPEGFEGNGYVNVAFVRAADSKEIFTSPLSYSAVPFAVGMDRRRINIELDTPERVKPGDRLHIRYRTAKPARIALFAVDEGILQVAKYHTPNPLAHFFRKQALEVKTFQIVDLILPEFRLAMEAAASGGGMDAAARKAIGSNLNPFRRGMQKPVAFWSGIIDADGSKQDYSIEVPDYFNGSLRLMAVAVSDEAIGVARGDVQVKGPFVISPNAPVMVAPGDTFEVSVGIANNLEDTDGKSQVQVAVVPTSQLSVVGAAEQQLDLASGSEGKVRFRIRAGDRPGAAELRFTASAAAQESHLTATMSVRPAVPYMATFASGDAADGEAEVAVARHLLPDYSSQEAVASHSPLVLVEGLAAYLRAFAHGCAEQMVSKVFPFLGFLNHPGLHVDKAKVQADFGQVINRLRSRQTASGAFEFWPGQGAPQGLDFPSVYIMHFLTDARELGYPVPEGMMQRGLGFLQRVAAGRGSETSPMEARVRAYAIYLLTRNRQVTSNYLIDLYSMLERQYKDEWLNDITAVYMAASFAMLHNERMQEKTLAGYRFGSDKQFVDSDFDGRLNQDAQYIYLLARHFPDRLQDKVGEKGIMALVQPLYRGEFNTLSAAYTMLALGAYTSHMPGAADDGDIVIKALAAAKEKALKTGHDPFARATFGTDAEQISFAGGKRLFYVVNQSGFDRDLPSQAMQQGLEIQREYLDKQGNVVTAAPLGSEVTVRLRVRAKDERHVTNVAIVDLLPGGFEVVRDSMRRSGSIRSWRHYEDIREDRVVIYGDFGPKVSKFEYRAKVTAAGEFVIPSAYAGSMYDRTLHARTVPGHFTVSGYEGAGQGE